MGHYEETVIGSGSSEAWAQADAVQSYLSENGDRCSLREVVSAEWLYNSVPMKWKTRHETPGSVYMDQFPDYSKPVREWDQVWQFVLHFHC